MEYIIINRFDFLFYFQMNWEIVNISSDEYIYPLEEIANNPKFNVYAQFFLNNEHIDSCLCPYFMHVMHNDTDTLYVQYDDTENYPDNMEGTIYPNISREQFIIGVSFYLNHYN